MTHSVPTRRYSELAGARKGRAGRGRPNPRSARGPQTSLYGEASRLVAAARRWRGHGRWRRRAAVDRAGGGRISRQAGIVRRGRAHAGARKRRHLGAQWRDSRARRTKQIGQAQLRERGGGTGSVLVEA